MAYPVFMCGAANRIITPPIGTLLYGYRPDVDSRSVHDDLTATAVAFGNGDPNDTTLLFSLTLGDIATELCNELRDKISKHCSIPFSNTIIAATHTHCAPNTSGVEGWGDIDRPFVDNILIPAVLEAGADAIKNMRDAQLGIAEGESRVGINRREQLPNGDIDLGQNPWGVYDPFMTVAVLRDAETKQGIVNIIHYGCHGTACGCAHEITRDWPGIMTDRMEKETGTLTVFFNGAIGDVGPRLTNGRTVGDISHVEELGGVAAADAMRIFKTVRTFTVPELKLYKGTVKLPYKPYPPLETVKAMLASITEPEKLINQERLQYAHLRDLEKKLSAGDTELPPPFSFEQTLIRIGDVVFIPCPFEAFSEISLRLRAYSPLQHTLLLSCANAYYAYLPTEDQLCRGGYEVNVFRFAAVDSLADNTDQNLINENLRILCDNTKEE